MDSKDINPQDSPLLKDDCSASITLPDGRELGYAEYGLKSGAAIICLHGVPGSRIDFARSDAAAKEVGARLIAVDRPGIGLSFPHKNASLLSHAKDIECLTETLGLESYAVLVRVLSPGYAMLCYAAATQHNITYQNRH